MATSTWVPPLPAGYEARWDPNQRAYFFINHNTKTTTWQDPRWPAQAQQRPTQPQQQHHGHAQAQSHHSAAAHSLNTGFTSSSEGQNVPMSTMYKQFGGTTTRVDNSEDEDWEDDWDSETELPFSDSTGDHGKVDIAKLHQLKQMFPSAPEDSIKQALRTNNNVLGMAKMQLTAGGYHQVESSSHPPPRQVDMLERLQAMFPTANKELVSDILYQANYDEKAARVQLEAIGYKAQYTPTHKSSSAHKANREASPAKRSVSPAKSPVRHQTPSRPTLSEADKANLLSKLKREYRDTEESVMSMAVEVCEYDETRVKNLLDRMKAEAETPRPSSSRTTTSSSRRSPSPTPVFSGSSLEPVAFEADMSTTDQRPKSKKSTTTTVSSRTTPTKTSRTPTPKSSATPTPRVSSSSARQQTRTKNVTELSEDVLSSTVDVLNHLATNVSCCQKQDDQSDQEEDLLAANQNQADSSHRQPQAVVSRQPQGTSYMSANRTVPKGPDHTLRVGPNRDLLIQEYVLAKGPNPELRQGPDRSRVMGPQGARGPDPSLRCGPQAGLSKGTSSENLLVSAI